MLWIELTTIVKKINNNPEHDKEIYLLASDIINSGGLVAFPTETVYGLGASYKNKDALKKIYSAKGRPQDNPLIVHISSLDELDMVTKDMNLTAEMLIREFWPGPLTLIFNKEKTLLKELTGGLDTVGVRMPDNGVATSFIRHCGVPIAAPSANSSGKPSPTRASHVEFDLNGKIDMIIDGGNSVFGLESTILDISVDKPILLRPGSITVEMIKNVIGDIEIDKTILTKIEKDFIPKAPGMKYTHYSPKAKITIVSGKIDDTVKKIEELTESLINENIKSEKIGIFATEESKSYYDSDRFVVLSVGKRKDEATIASNLFKILRKFDYYNVDYVFSESFSETSLGLAIMNRLKKAAGYNILNV